jgi:hypothetical protein
MVIGSFAVLAGPSPWLDELRRLVEQRLLLAPRYQQRVRRGLIPLLRHTQLPHGSGVSPINRSSCNPSAEGVEPISRRPDVTPQPK